MVSLYYENHQIHCLQAMNFNMYEQITYRMHIIILVTTECGLPKINHLYEPKNGVHYGTQSFTKLLLDLVTHPSICY